MIAENFSLQSYFDRIGFRREARADIATVAALMRCQLQTVPFENLDVQAGKIVSLVPEEIVAKIVGRRRGGYCYEVNGLFAMALQALGIPYQFIAARPMFYPVRRPRTHMAIVASIDGEDWLCDLGFGSYGIRAPMRLNADGVEVAQDFDRFVLSKTSDRDYLLQAWVDGEWVRQYGFDLSPQEWIDFVPANHFNSTHPDTIFVQKLLVVIHSETGRRTLLDHTLKTIENGVSTQREIAAEARDALLRDGFGLDVM